MKEATKAELKEVFSLKRIMWVLIGNTIYSCGIAAFVLPNDLITWRNNRNCVDTGTLFRSADRIVCCNF